jgi:hypothetical protein
MTQTLYAFSENINILWWECPQLTVLHPRGTLYNVFQFVSACFWMFLDISRYVSMAQLISTWFTMLKLNSTCFNIVHSISISLSRLKMSNMFLYVSVYLIMFLSDSVWLNMFQYVSICFNMFQYVSVCFSMSESWFREQSKSILQGVLRLHEHLLIAIIMKRRIKVTDAEQKANTICRNKNLSGFLTGFPTKSCPNTGMYYLVRHYFSHRSVIDCAISVADVHVSRRNT